MPGVKKAYCYSDKCINEYLCGKNSKYKRYKQMYPVLVSMRTALLKIRKADCEDIQWTEKHDKFLDSVKKDISKMTKYLDDKFDQIAVEEYAVYKENVTKGTWCPDCGWALRWKYEQSGDSNERKDLRGDFGRHGGISPVDISEGFRISNPEFAGHLDGYGPRCDEEEVY